MKKYKEENEIAWINAAKFVAILAVLVDHTSTILYENRGIKIASYFSVSLFILLAGMTMYISIRKNQKGWFQTFLHLSKKIVIAYGISVGVYQVVTHRYFDFITYVKYLTEFNIAGPHYFVFLYLQLAFCSKAIYNIVNYKGKFPEGVKNGISLGVVIIVSYFTTNYTNVLNIYGGGGKLLGGTYLIVFYFGMLLMRYYTDNRISLKRNVIIAGLSIGLAVIWWRFECADSFSIDSKLPFGAGFNPPGITLIVM